MGELSLFYLHLQYTIESCIYCSFQTLKSWTVEGDRTVHVEQREYKYNYIIIIMSRKD